MPKMPKVPKMPKKKNNREDKVAPATVEKRRMLRDSQDSQDNLQQSAAADIKNADEILDAFDDPEFFALALEQLGWDPYKEILEILSVASQDENLPAKLKAIQMLGEKRDEIRRRAGQLVDAETTENVGGRKTVFSSEILAKTITKSNERSNDNGPESESKSIGTGKDSDEHGGNENSECSSGPKPKEKTPEKKSEEESEEESEEAAENLEPAIHKQPDEGLARTGLAKITKDSEAETESEGDDGGVDGAEAGGKKDGSKSKSGDEVQEVMSTDQGRTDDRSYGVGNSEDCGKDASRSSSSL